MELRRRFDEFLARIERDVIEDDRAADRRREGKRLPDEIKEVLAARGFEIVRDESFPKSFGDRIIELERGRLRVRMASDRSYWGIEIAGRASEFFDIHLWRDLLDPPETADEMLSFTRRASYLTSRLDQFDALVSDPIHPARRRCNSSSSDSTAQNGGGLVPT